MKKITHQQQQQQQQSQTDDLGCVAATILLSDWGNYGLSERVAYHFHLTEALAAVDRDRDGQAASIHNVCGVVQLLECVPTLPLKRMTRPQKRSLRENIRQFNETAQKIHQEARQHCHEPAFLPLRLNPATRVYFSYESTRIALVLDASPTLTSTFGSADPKYTCPLDRIGDMTRKLFKALVEPIRTNSRDATWQPNLTVTVMAVYPQGEPSLLVRDYRVKNVDDAIELASQMQNWALQTVESEIAYRLAHKAIPSYHNMESCSSRLADLIQAGDAAISILSSAARPCIIVATDARSIACESTIEVVTDMDRADVPVSILDLSNPDSHGGVANRNRIVERTSLHSDNGALFPLHWSDDAEGLYRIARATGGVFFNQDLLGLATETYAGKVPQDSRLAADHFLAFKRHSIRPNAVQWYLLFVQSPLSPSSQGKGKLEPPEYLRRRLQVNMAGRGAGVTPNPPISLLPRHSADKSGFSQVHTLGGTAASTLTPSMGMRHHEKAVFATYDINPIRIHGLLLMRVKEGYQALQYGQSTNEPDKVVILFTLQLDMGLVLYYEVSYKALSHNHMVGVVHIKLELSGDPSFLQVVKHDFLHSAAPSVKGKGAQHQYSELLCELIRKTRKEDTLQSQLAPTAWRDQLGSSDTLFVRRLQTLSIKQRRRHFRHFEFDCVCVGMMPYTDDDDFLRDFWATDNGEQELKTCLKEWSSQVVTEDRRYVRKMENPEGLVSYCVVDVSSSSAASRVFTISIDTFGTFGAKERLEVMSSLKDAITDLRDVKLLEQQISKYLVGVRSLREVDAITSRERFLACQHKRAVWDLVNDPELLPLLMKRRTEIGGFHLIESHDTYALFAKVSSVTDAVRSGSGAGNLVQYKLGVMPSKVLVELRMESESGDFFSSTKVNSSSEFARTVRSVKRRDQECGRALKSRTSLLRALDTDLAAPSAWLDEESQSVCIQRLLAYASKASIQLRFFLSDDGLANSMLASMTEDMLLSGNFRARVARIFYEEDSGPDREASDGPWFIVEFDRQTISLVHLSATNTTVGEPSAPQHVREMTFYTVSISDLYNHREDTVDDDSEDDHVSEHMRVTDFTDNVIAHHGYNYALAAYFALQHASQDQATAFGISDFEKAIEHLSFAESTSVVIGGELESSSSKLVSLLKSILGSCPDDDCCFYYRGTPSDTARFGNIDDFSLVSSSSDDDESPYESEPAEEDLANESESHGHSEIPSHYDQDGDVGVSISPPLFVKLFVDGTPVSFSDLALVSKSAVLTAKLSIFASSDSVAYPPSHVGASLDLTRLLNAYVAEQTLERLRTCGSTIEEGDCRLARRCLRNARDVLVLKHELLFYSVKSRDMVQMSTVGATDTFLRDAFDLLAGELQENPSVSLQALSSGLLVSKEVESFSTSLSFWCFVSMRVDVVTAEVLHPDGQQATELALKRIQDAISTALFRVNQRLLLRGLHASRTASALLIPPDKEDIDSGLQDNDRAIREDDKFQPGNFQCENVSTTSLSLFHRCATNPQQVARSLEASVLHIFSISNRRHVFVYKDESGSIFYMQLHASGGGVEADGTIQLRLYGVDEPPVSVAEQLARLLKKKLMSIATDMLSSVLVQNTQYLWKSDDLDYVWTFQEEWKALEGSTSTEPMERIYAIPTHVADPAMVMLYFRQNICGSTHFNALKSLDWPPSSGANDCTKKLDFVFVYNDSPSKLDPKFQATSTLTSKGLELSRKIGSGVAVIELSLLDENGLVLEDINVEAGGEEIKPRLSILQPKASFLHLVEDSRNESLALSSSKNFFKVKVTSTNMKLNFLHEWIHLSLNQVAAAWTIEKILRSKSYSSATAVKLGTVDAASGKSSVTEKIVPGLPNLTRILKDCLQLPHPGVLETESLGVIRSSHVAKVAFQMLEHGILKQLAAVAPNVDYSQNLVIVRTLRDGKPHRVKFSKEGSVVLPENNQAIDDPTDCPEYLCFYCSPEWGENAVAIPKLFPEVVVSADLSMKVGPIKEQYKELFRRSFAFVLVVKRNRRHLVTYNLSPSLQEKVAASLLEINTEFMLMAESATGTLLRRSLACLSPKGTGEFKRRLKRLPSQKSKRTSSKVSVSESAESSGSVETTRVEGTRPIRNPSRRAIRPVSIRRPNLIGRSIEGAAAHAAAASRDRAKSQFPGPKLLSSNASMLRRSQSKDTASSATKSARPRPLPVARRSEKLKKSVTLDVQEKKVAQEHINVPSAAPQERVAALVSHELRARVETKMFDGSNENSALMSVDFLVRHSTPMWSESLYLPPLSPSTLRSFESRMAHALCNWDPDLKMVKTLGGLTHMSQFFAFGAVKNVRSCKCFAVLRLRLQPNGKGRSPNSVLLKCDGWIMTKPRQKKSKKRVHLLRYYHNSKLDERDAMGLMLLSHQLQRVFPIIAMVSDFSGMVTEMGIASCFSTISAAEAIGLTLQLEKRYSLKEQVIIPQLRYNSYVAHITLASYGDAVINLFDGPRLFDWIKRNAQSSSVRVAPRIGVYFKEEIIVRGTISYCFLACNEHHKGRMKLHILCRNNGCSLYEFMFREGSSVALSIADVIAVEAAGLALKRLRLAARSLRRDILWASASRSRGSKSLQPVLSSNELHELVQYCTRSPVTFTSRHHSEILNEATNEFPAFRRALSAEPSFQPYRSFANSRHMFYCSSDDVFILLTEDTKSGCFEIVEKVASEASRSRCLTKLLNFALHFEWHSLTS